MCIKCFGETKRKARPTTLAWKEVPAGERGGEMCKFYISGDSCPIPWQCPQQGGKIDLNTIGIFNKFQVKVHRI